MNIIPTVVKKETTFPYCAIANYGNSNLKQSNYY